MLAQLQLCERLICKILLTTGMLEFLAAKSTETKRVMLMMMFSCKTQLSCVGNDDLW